MIYGKNIIMYTSQMNALGCRILMAACMHDFRILYNMAAHDYYHSVPGKCPWSLIRDQNSIGFYRNCYSDHLKCGTWALTLEWALAQDTIVCPQSHCACLFDIRSIKLYYTTG